MAHAPCRGRCGAAYVFLACLLLANPLWAETLSLTVRGGAHAAYDRLVFDLPQKIPYQVAQQGQEMRLTFQKSVRLNLAPLLAARLSRVGSYGVLEGDTTTFVMTMGAGARPKIFENKGAVVVDVAGARITQQAGVMRAPSASMAAAPEASPQEKTATEKTPPEKKTADQPAATPEKTNTVQPVPTQPHDAQSEQAQGVQQSSVTEMGAATSQIDMAQAVPDAVPEVVVAAVVAPAVEGAQTPETLADPAAVPAAVAPSAAPTTVAPPAVAEAATAPTTATAEGEITQSSPAESSPPELSSTQSSSTGAPPADHHNTPKDQPAPSAQQPTPAEQPKAGTQAIPDATTKTDFQARAMQPIISIMQLEAGPQTLFTVDPGVAVGMAAYQRGGYAYIIFDRNLGLSLDKLLQGQHAGKTEMLDLKNATGFRFSLPQGVDLRLSRHETAWHIKAQKPDNNLPLSMTFNAEPDYVLGARLVLPVSGAGTPVNLTDPVTGENLVVVPLQQAGQQITRSQFFPDVVTLPTAQGILLLPRHDKVKANITATGIELVDEKDGLKLSPMADTGRDGGATNTKLPRLSLVDLKSWRGREGDYFVASRRRLWETMVTLPEGERAYTRLHLARLHLAYGQGSEAMVILNQLARDVPDMASSVQFLAIRGAARILAGDVAAGLRDMDRIGEGGIEMDLWRAVAEAKLRDFQAAWPKFQSTAGVLMQMPEPVFTHMLVLGLETGLALGQAVEAYEWLAQFKNMHEEVFYNPKIQYLRGVMDYQFGHVDKAENLWRMVALSRDRLYRTRAELALVDLAVAKGKMKPADAAKRLEGLRFVWRGDDLELDILARLGKFYLDGNKYVDGFTTLSTATRLYPDDPKSAELRAEMSELLRKIYLENAAPAMGPLEALGLYQQFNSMAPVGEVGDAIARKLAEKLVTVDLLDQAAALLDKQVRERLSGPLKAEVGAQLAAIRLLNKQPDQALESLDNSAVDGISETLDDERHLLRARAHMELGDFAEAETTLGDIGEEAANALRVDIAWRNQRWADAAKLLGALIGAPPARGDKLAPEKITLLLNRATALVLAGDEGALAQLARDFSPALAGLPEAGAFRLLTQAQSDQFANPSDIIDRLNDVDLFKQFLDKYRTRG